MLLLILTTVLLLWVLRRQWKMNRILVLSRKLRNKYTAVPIVGHGLMFLGTSEDRMKTFQKLGREAIKSKYGLTSLWLGSQYYTLTCDPIVAGVVTKCSLGKTELSEISRGLMGNGSIFAPVHIWRPRRKVLAPTFSPKNINCYVEIFAEQSMVMVGCLRSKAGSGTFSIWNNIASYTMDCICRTVLGIEMNTQKHSFNPFLLAFEKYCKIISARLVQPWLHWDSLYKLLPVHQEAERSRKIIHDFVDDCIRQKKTPPASEDMLTALNTNVGIRTFLDLLIESSGGSDGYTDQEIREELLVLLLAGTDTSAVGASFTSVMLSRHSTVQEKAYEEIREIFGDSKRHITFEDLSQLKYIDAIVKETLRLYPPVPIIMRKHEKDIELYIQYECGRMWKLGDPQDSPFTFRLFAYCQRVMSEAVKFASEITLPAGSNTSINIWAIHRNPRYWGADAEEFNPDRFLTGPPIHRTAYMPFSSGPRNCLGYQYAMMSIKIMVATLLREYKVLPSSDVSPENMSEPLRVEFDVMMKDVDKFKIRLENRT